MKKKYNSINIIIIIKKINNYKKCQVVGKVAKKYVDSRIFFSNVDGGTILSFNT